MVERGEGSGGQQQQRRRPSGSTVNADGSTVIADAYSLSMKRYIFQWTNSDCSTRLEPKKKTATQRPDGSWRREIRVRDGFVPRDEMAPYRPPSQRVRVTRSGRVCIVI